MGSISVGSENIETVSNGSGLVTLADPCYATVAVGEFIAGTAIMQLPDVACRYAALKARATNTGKAYFGTAGVTAPDGTADTTTGWPLLAGEETPWLPVANLNQLYSVADTVGQSIIYMVVR